MSILIHGGTIVTMTSDHGIIEDGAVYIEGNRIIAVGRSAEMLDRFGSQKGVRTISTQNRVIYPGFVNVHTHGALTILRGQAEDEPSYTAVYKKMSPVIKMMTDEDAYHMSRLAYLELLKYGSTTVVDTLGTKSESMAKAAVETGIRAYLNSEVYDVDQEKMKDQVYEYSDARGEEYLGKSLDFIDRWHMAENGRIRAIMVAHAPDTCSRRLLEKVVEAAQKYDLGVTIHLAQNEVEIRQVKDLHKQTVGQYLESTGILKQSFIGAHGIFLEEEDIALLGKYKATLAHCATINAKRGWVAPVKKLLAQGVNISLGTDNMASDILQTMKVAQMAYRIVNQVSDEPKSEAILEMGTVNGAKAIDRKEELGAIMENGLADLVIINYNKPNYVPLFKKNIVSNLIHTGLAADIETVIVDGEILVEKGVYIKDDEAGILKNAKQVADRIWIKWSQLNNHLS